MKLARRFMLPLACSAPILLGCSAPAVAPVASGSGAMALKVQPLLRVRDAAASARDFYQLGRYYQGQNRLAQAEAAYRKALEYHRDDIEARNALATTYSQQGKLDEAIAEFEAILKIKPELAHLHNNLGYTYYLQGSFGKAVAAFETAMAFEPKNPRAYNNLGLAYRKMGEAEKSRLAFSRAEELNRPDVAPGGAAQKDAGSSEPAPSIALKNDAPLIDLSRPVLGVALVTSNPEPVLAGTEPAATVATAVAVAAVVADMQQRPAEVSGRAVPPKTGDAGSQSQEPPVVLEARGAAGATYVGQAESAAAGLRKFRLEIANGNGVPGLARQVGARLARQGLPVVNLTNLRPYRQPVSLILYRHGFQEEAQRLSDSMRHPPVLTHDTQLRRGVDVQLVLGKDAMHPVALFGDSPVPAKVAEKTVLEKRPG